MGGKALTTIKKERMSKKNYLILSKKLIDEFSQYYEVCKIAPSLPQKQDFGDIDLIVSNQIKNTESQLLIDSKEIKKNGNILSFNYEDIQVDLTFTQYENLDLQILYYSYGDFGRILGLHINRLDLKMNQKGLFILIDKQYYLFITNCIQEIMHILQLNFEQYKTGFFSQIDIFEFFLQSKIFRYIYQQKFINSDFYNHKNSRRDIRKRQMIQDYYFYAKNKQIEEQDFNLQDFQQDIINKYNLQQHIYEKRQQQNIQNIFKTKINGQIVQNLTNCQNKEIGQIINQVCKTQCKQQICLLEQDEIQKLILQAKLNLN